MMVNTPQPASEIECDLLVIGAGLAGMAAAARASSLGLKTVMTGSSSGFFMTSGLMDFLGVYPVASAQVLETPFSGLNRLRKEVPCHPYAKVTDEEILSNFEFIAEFLKAAGLEYHIDSRKNVSVLTSAGTFKPTYMVPESVMNGCVLSKEKKSLLLVDFEGLKGYSAKQIAAVLEKQGYKVKNVSITVPGFAGDFNVTRLASRFESPLFLHDMVKQILPFLDQIDLIGFPAVCGINHCSDVLHQIEEMTGTACFEIPGLPPSVPGLRLKNAFEKQLSQNQVIMLNNAVARFVEFQDKGLIIDAVFEQQATRIAAKAVILASGRFPGGGLHAKRGLICETVFNIPVVQPAHRKFWYDVNLFHPQGHGINQAGIETDSAFRPLDKNGKRICDRLYAAGSILAHNDWVRLKSGAGSAIVSACQSVDHFHAMLGGRDV